MVRLPKNLSNTVAFKSGVIKTGASVLETELLGEKAYSLGLAAKSVQMSLSDLNDFKGTQTERDKLLQVSANIVQAFFIQRELMGLTDHSHPISYYEIPKDVLNRIGVTKR